MVTHNGTCLDHIHLLELPNSSRLCCWCGHMFRNGDKTFQDTQLAAIDHKCSEYRVDGGITQVVFAPFPARARTSPRVERNQLNMH